MNEESIYSCCAQNTCAIMLTLGALLGEGAGQVPPAMICVILPVSELSQHCVPGETSLRIA